MSRNGATRGPGISSWDYVHERLAAADAARMAWLDAHKHEDDPDPVRALERKRQKEAKR